MPTLDLSGVDDGPSHRMVFDRACEQLDAFKRVADAWTEEGAYLIAEERDRDAFQVWGQDLLDTWGHTVPEFPEDAIGAEAIFREHYPINPNWSLIVNEAIHGFRSSLDHLVFSLSLASGPLTDKEMRASEFPIFHESGPDGGVPDLMAKKIAKLNCNDRAVIDQLQPYKNADYSANPLWVLQTLDIVGKHRVLPVIASFNTTNYVELTPGVRVYWANPGHGALVNGAPIARYVFGPAPDGNMKVRFTADVELMFGLIMGDQLPPALLAIPGSFAVADLGVPVPNFGSVTDTLASIRDYIAAEVFPPLEASL